MIPTFTVVGKISAIFPTEQVNNFFEKRVLWLQEPGTNKPQNWQFELHQNDTNLLDNFERGQDVECNIEVKGNLYSKNGRENVFNVLKCIMIKKL